MRILYGVVGEGMGHAMRSRVVLERLLEDGHEVSVMASGRAVDFLRKHVGQDARVQRIFGWFIVYEENRVRRGKTAAFNLLAGIEAVPSQIRSYFELMRDFRPQCVISDFESWTYVYAKLHNLPVISIDNMQVLNRCSIPDEIIGEHRTDFEIAKALVKAKLPFADHYLVTSFFRPDIRKPNTTLVPPILRAEILQAKATRGEHLLVYQTAEGNDTLVKALAESAIPCRIYGMKRELKADESVGNLLYRPFSETAFIDDLASARGVIASGGFTLMGECVYLHKPMLAVPVRGQFEQVLNARYLERCGYGMYAESLERASIVHEFVENLDRYQTALDSYQQAGNDALFAELAIHLDRVAAGVY